MLGGSAIEASKIAGHSDLEMTGEYTFVAPERQNELTRRIQETLASAANKKASEFAAVEEEPMPPPPPPSTTPEAPPSLDSASLASLLVQ